MKPRVSQLDLILLWLTTSQSTLEVGRIVGMSKQAVHNRLRRFRRRPLAEERDDDWGFEENGAFVVLPKQPIKMAFGSGVQPPLDLTMPHTNEKRRVVTRAAWQGAKS